MYIHAPTLEAAATTLFMSLATGLVWTNFSEKPSTSREEGNKLHF